MSGPGTAAPQDWTVGRLLDWTAKFLTEKGSESPRLDAEVLLAHALSCKRIELYVRHDELASDAVRMRFREQVRKRVEGCPVAYLVGRKEFFSLDLEVSPKVLIPRPDTETLVVATLEVVRGQAAPRILDVGTGSGNVAIALAKNLPAASVTTIDVSREALEVARRNAARHGLGERIRFLEGDLFAPLAADERFDCIVSNPPYVAREMLAQLQPGVRDYEPHLALDGGPGGYEVVERLIARAPHHLQSGGWVLLEIGTVQEETIRAALQGAGLQVEQTIRDHSRHPRVVRGRLA